MDSTFAAEKPARPVVAPPDAPLAPGIENKPAPAAAAAAVAHRSASLSGSSTRRDGEITENEKADSALEPATEVAPKTRPDEGTNKGEALPEPAEEHQWISGMQLFTVMAGVVLACFLMFLDTTVIVTVSSLCPLPSICRLHHQSNTDLEALTSKGHPVHHKRLPLFKRCGLVWKRISASQRRLAALDGQGLLSF
jgi:hypothetical protein